MPTARLLAFMLLTLFASGALAQEPAKKTDRDQKLEIEKIQLDNTKVTLPCPPGRRSRSESCNDSAMIVVAAILSKDTPKTVELHTTVSGGRITSKKGLQFHWDLSGVPPGKYTFAVQATDGNGGWGHAVTETVDIVECPDCAYGDSCYIPRMDEVKSVAAGELMEFTVKVSGDPDDSITYNWSVSAGVIESGQGTKSIKVRTDESMEGQSITATVEIGNLPPGPSCQNTASETGAVTAKKPKEN